VLLVAVAALAVAVGLLQGAAFGGTPVVKVSAVKPAKAEVGTVVVIKGAHFDAITAVKFNGVSAVFTVDSSRMIHATVPVGGTTGSVSVLTATQTAPSKHVFTVLYDAPFQTCLASGSAVVPAGTEPYIGIAKTMLDQSYVKVFRQSTRTTLTINGTNVNNANHFWDKKGEYEGVNVWETYWGYDPGIVLAKAGDTMKIGFRVVASKPFSDGTSTFQPGAEIFTGSSCTLTAS
jgi:hypothetical protein